MKAHFLSKQVAFGVVVRLSKTWVILCMRPANQSRYHIATSPLIGWAHAQKDPCRRFVSNKRLQAFVAQAIYHPYILNVSVQTLRLWGDKTANNKEINNFWKESHCRNLRPILVVPKRSERNSEITNAWLTSGTEYSISQEICTRFLLCCALLWLYIDWCSHIHPAYFTGTVAI